MHYKFGCKKTSKVYVRGLLQAPLSLKSAASKIVFRLQNEQTTRFDNKITCKPFSFSGLPADILLENLLS